MPRLLPRLILATLAVAVLLAPFAARAADRVIAAGELTELIAQELAGRQPDMRHEISFTGAPVLTVPEGAAPTVVSLDYQDRTGAFIAQIMASAAADPVRVTGRAQALVEAPAVVRPLQSGEHVTAADLVWIEVPANRLPSDAVLDPAMIEGMEAKRTLRPGAPIRRFDVTTPSVITKNELVTVFYIRPGIQLAARGRALEDAPQGSALRILNLQSNRVIEAVAEAPGRARVEAPRMYAANGEIQ